MSSKKQNHSRPNLIDDITALRQDFTVNNAILSAIPDMIFILNRDLVFMDYVSGPDLKPLMEPHEFIGKHIKEVLPPEIASQAIENLILLFRDGESRSFNYELEDEAGRHQYEARLVMSGKDVAIAIVRDVTEEKVYKQGLVESGICQLGGGVGVHCHGSHICSYRII